MEFIDFDRLHRNDPLVFHMGVEVLMQIGRNLILESNDHALVFDLKPKLGGFFTEEKLYEVARAAQRLAELETKTFLEFMQRKRILPGPAPEESSETEILSPAQADGRALCIDLGYAVLETSVTLPTPDSSVEVAVNLVFPDGEHQDIAMVRPMECRKGCEVLVWRNEEDEDYTDSFEIPIRSDEEEQT